MEKRTILVSVLENVTDEAVLTQVQEALGVSDFTISLMQVLPRIPKLTLDRTELTKGKIPEFYLSGFELPEITSFIGYLENVLPKKREVMSYDGGYEISTSLAKIFVTPAVPF